MGDSQMLGLSSDASFLRAFPPGRVLWLIQDGVTSMSESTIDADTLIREAQDTLGKSQDGTAQAADELGSLVGELMVAEGAIQQACTSSLRPALYTVHDEASSRWVYFAG